MQGKAVHFKFLQFFVFFFFVFVIIDFHWQFYACSLINTLIQTCLFLFVFVTKRIYKFILTSLQCGELGETHALLHNRCNSVAFFSDEQQENYN